MKLESGYCICHVCGADYLMPVGQNIADFGRGMKLNPSSALLLQFLKEEHSFEEVVRLFCETYEILPEDEAGLRDDLKQTIRFLTERGYLNDGRRDGWLEEQRSQLNYKIGPLVVGINGPERMMHRFLASFATEEALPADQIVTMYSGAPYERVNGEVVIRNEDVILMDAGAFYVFLFPVYDGIHELHVTKDGTRAVCYYQWLGTERAEELIEQLFHALRFSFLILAEKHQIYAVHSASMLYDGKAWLFSASSGTGKSTHVGLWQEAFGVSPLNGDLNLIGMQNGVPVVYGIPWCGTSEIYTTETYPLGGIGFLKRSEADRVEQPEEDDAAILLMNRVIYPVWTDKTIQRVGTFAETIVQNAQLFRVFCTKNPSAATAVKEWIDDRKK